MTIPSGPVPSFPKTKGLQSGIALQKISDMIGSGATDLVAKAGGTKAAATPVTATNVRVATVANAADSILLPLGYVGLEICIANAGNNSMQVFGNTNDTINDVVTATGVAQANGVTAIYRCLQTTGSVAAGTYVAQWYRVLSA